jgi:hypothetical protein
VTIVLRSLLQQRHLHEYSEFVVEYDGRAKELDLARHASAPTTAQYYRGVGGNTPATNDRLLSSIAPAIEVSRGASTMSLSGVAASMD